MHNIFKYIESIIIIIDCIWVFHSNMQTYAVKICRNMQFCMQNNLYTPPTFLMSLSGSGGWPEHRSTSAPGKPSRRRLIMALPPGGITVRALLRGLRFFCIFEKSAFNQEAIWKARVSVHSPAQCHAKWQRRCTFITLQESNPCRPTLCNKS